MVNNQIVLRNLDEIQQFVKLADACDFDVNIGYDRVVIDAKSIVGIMGLDLGRKMMVTFPERNEALEAFCEAHRA